MLSSSLLSNFQACLSKAGLIVDKIIADGHIHRCPVEGRPNGLDGSYKANLDKPASIWWRNWVTGDTGTWAEKSTPLSKEQREVMRQNIQKLKAAYEGRRSNMQSAAANVASIILRDTPQASDSYPYLQRKKVPAFYGVHESTHGELIIPLQDINGQVTSLQFISSAGKKRFLKGGALSGSFFKIPARKEDGPLLIAEGYATAASVHLATGFEALAAFTAMNLKAVAIAARKQFPDREIILCADNDCQTTKTDGTPWNPGVEAATEAAQAVGGKLAVCPAHEGRATDFNDLHAARGLNAVQQAIKKAWKGLEKPRKEEAPEKIKKYRCLNIEEFILRKYPPRDMILSPVLAVQSLSMIFAMRGIGKTFFALSCAYAIASGGSVFGRWFSPRPARVLYIDGEMPAVTLQERLKKIGISADSDITNPDMLRILTPDEQDGPMPNLGTREGQEAVEPFLEGVALVVVDNIATLARTGKANDEDSWLPVQEWLLDLRRRGISVLLVHHAGKNGSQRGTGAKEDILDTVIELRRPSDYKAEQGARFEVHFTKARGLYGEDTEPFEAMLAIDGQCSWSTRKVENTIELRIIEMLEAGLSEREIVEELKDDHIGRTRIRRIRQEMEGEGKSFSKSKGGAGTHRERA